MKYFLAVWAIFCLVACNNSGKEEEAPRQVTQYSIEQFYKSTDVSGGSISSDDAKMLVNSNESGIYNVYEIDIASGQRKVLTNSAKESVFADDYVPGTINFIYNSDKGGDENSHLFLQKTNGNVKELTPGKKEKATFLGWSRDNKYMFYTSNKRDPRFFDLYKMDTANWTPVLFYKNQNGYNVSCISDDERYLGLVQPVTLSTTNIYILDQKNSQLKKINTDSTGSNNKPLQFSRDSKTFYYTTDEGSEYQYVIKYDIGSGKKDKIYTANWDAMYLYTSFNEKYRVVGVNEDARNKLYVFDHKTGAPVNFPKIEDGEVRAVNISRSENKMRLTVGNSKSPANIYVYDFETKELKKLTNTLNPEIKDNELVSAEVIRYKSYDGLEIPAVYYKPLQAGKTNKVPALVWVHGGPGGQSDVGYSPLIQYLVNHGYAILAVNNRGSSGYGKTFNKMDNRSHGDRDLKDCIWGKKYLASLDYIDSAKVGIIGESYGGYMTLAALSFHPDEFNVGVDMFGVANWLRTLRDIPSYWESIKKAIYEEVGDPNTADSVRLKEYSPLLHASNIKKPLIVLQGANDPRVLQKESDEVVAAVKKNNIPIEYIVFPDEGHGFQKKENEIKGYGQILQFLDHYLKGEQPKTKKD